MIDALRFEWVRIRTLRSTYWLIGSALVLNATVAVSVSFGTRNDPVSNEFAGAVITGGGPYSPLPIAAVLMAVMGIFATGHEYRYGTIQPTLTTVPRRPHLLAAKIIVVGGAALVVTVVSMLVNAAAGLLIRGELANLTEVPLAGALPGYLLLAVLWTVLGIALAQVFRGVPTALVVILMVPLIVEQLIFRLSFVPALDWLVPVVKFLPFTAGQQLVYLGGERDVDFFGRWLSGGVFAAFVVAILATAWTLFKKRDA